MGRKIETDWGEQVYGLLIVGSAIFGPRLAGLDWWDGWFVLVTQVGIAGLGLLVFLAATRRRRAARATHHEPRTDFEPPVD